MVYISSGGQLSSNRQWGVSSVPDMFWGLINFIVLFFQTLANPNLTKRGDGYASSSYSNRGGGQGPPGPPRRRIGGLHGHGGAAPPPPAGG